MAMQGWIPDVDMMQVFDNELGLFLSRDFYVTPIPFVDQREFGGFKAEYVDICHGAKLEYSVSAQWDLDSSLGNEFAAASPLAAQRILDGKDHFLRRYDEWDCPGHESGLVIIKLPDSREIANPGAAVLHQAI